MGWYVLDKYYKSSDEAPAYTTALLLHPMRRKKYIDLNWDPSWCGPALKAAREIWAKYKDLPLEENAGDKVDDSRELSEFEKLAQELDVTEDDNEDEFEKFVTASPHKITCSPLQWWCKEEQRLEYPRLHKMAIDILSIPPMSDEAERVFSGVRRTISWDRARLGAWIVEMTELLGNWNKNDLIRVLHVLTGEDDEVISLSATGGNDIDIFDCDNSSQ
jgi:hypothetical protein